MTSIEKELWIKNNWTNPLFVYVRHGYATNLYENDRHTFREYLGWIYDNHLSNIDNLGSKDYIYVAPSPLRIDELDKYNRSNRLLANEA